MQERASLMLVVDEPLYVEGVRAMLARSAPSVLCVAVRAASAAMDLLTTAGSVDVVIADHCLPGPISGMALLQQIGRYRAGIARVLLSAADDPVLSQQAQRHGFAGCLSKCLEPADWLQSLAIILAGGRAFPAQSVARSALNERQVSVLQLASAGLGNKQIADRLNLTERTVKYHLHESFLRLSCSSRTVAVARAAALGLIQVRSG